MAAHLYSLKLATLIGSQSIDHNHGIMCLNLHALSGWVTCRPVLTTGPPRIYSQNPRLDADLHLNPGDGYLDGDVRHSVSDGVAKFQELTIGREFKIWFQSYPSEADSIYLEAVETIKIDASIEYEVQARGDLTNRHSDLYRSAVALDGEFLAVGAPLQRFLINDLDLNRPNISNFEQDKLKNGHNWVFLPSLLQPPKTAALDMVTSNLSRE